MHASADAPRVNVTFGGTEFLSGLAFKAAVPVELVPGSYAVRVDGRLPDPVTPADPDEDPVETVNVIPGMGGTDPTIDVAEGQITTVIAYGNVGGTGADAITATTVLDSSPTPAAGQSRVRVFHGAVGVGAVQVWLTAPGVTLDPADPNQITANVAYGNFLTPAPIDVAAGSYQIRVSTDAAGTNVVFDSGTVALADGGNLVIAAVGNTLAQNPTPPPAVSPIQLIASDGVTGDLIEFIDVDTPSNLRAFHAVSQAGGVDVAVDGTTAFTNVTFTTAQGPASVFLDEVNEPQNVDIEVFGTGTTDPVLADAEEELTSGESKTAFVIGTTTDTDLPIEIVVSQEATRSVATDAQARLVHGSAFLAKDAMGMTQTVDIYVVDVESAENAAMQASPPGDPVVIPPSGDIPEELAPALSGVAFGAATDYQILRPGADYQVAITAAGSKTPIIGPAVVNFTAGSIQTVIVVDELNLGMMPTLQIETF